MFRGSLPDEAAGRQETDNAFEHPQNIKLVAVELSRVIEYNWAILNMNCTAKTLPREEGNMLAPCVLSKFLVFHPRLCISGV